MKKLLPLLLLLACGQAMAQTPYSINQNTNKSLGGDDNGMGSSFKTIGAAHLDSIDVIIRSGTSSTCRVYVYNGNTTSNGSLLRAETKSGVPVGTEAIYRIRFSNSVSMAAASTYTFMVHDVPLRFDYANTYADGSLWTGAGFMPAGEHAGSDLDFIAYFGAPIVTANEEATDGQAHFIYANRTITTKNFNADEIIVHDLKGQAVASGKGESLTLSDGLTTGIYVVSLRKDKQVFTERIVVQ